MVKIIRWLFLYVNEILNTREEEEVLVEFTCLVSVADSCQNPPSLRSWDNSTYASYSQRVSLLRITICKHVFEEIGFSNCYKLITFLPE